MSSIDTTVELVGRVYDQLDRNLAVVRRRLGRPLSYAEKVFLGHLADADGEELEVGRSYVSTRPDRIAIYCMSASKRKP